MVAARGVRPSHAPRLLDVVLRLRELPQLPTCPAEGVVNLRDFVGAGPMFGNAQLQRGLQVWHRGPVQCKFAVCLGDGVVPPTGSSARRTIRSQRSSSRAKPKPAGTSSLGIRPMHEPPVEFAPFLTILEGIQAAGPGTTLSIKAEEYHEPVSVIFDKRMLIETTERTPGGGARVIIR